MTAPMIAAQILHFKGRSVAIQRRARHPAAALPPRVIRNARAPQARHPPFVTLEPKACRAQLFQGLTFDVKIDTLGE
jgi:hypothetical protein